MKRILFLASIALFSATSNSQVTWNRHAGNPVMKMDIDPGATEIYAMSVVFHKGKYHNFYTRKVGPKIENIGYAVSDDGLAWTAVDSVVLPLSTDATRFDCKQVGQPSVISEGDTLKMWYWGSGPHGGNIGMAWSLDGKAWTRVNGAATDKSVYDLTMDGASSPAIACPNVIKDGSGYKMWYSRVKVTGAVISYVTAHASSPDGITWTKVPGAGANGAVLENSGLADHFDTKMAFFPCVIKDGSTYRMWYTGLNGEDEYGIGYATSTDGIAWTVTPGTGHGGSILEGAATGSVLKSGDGYKIWFIGETGMDYATSGLSVGVYDRAHPLAGKYAPSGARFDSRGKRIESVSRRHPGMIYKRP
jgi:hypothetical protein